ncbi:MAG: polymer-forming cytoskeletal protein [Cyclobacteriaceae bacterium]
MLNKKDNKEAELSNTRNILGKGAILTGNLETYGNILVEGKVIGDIKSKSKVVFGETAVIDGNVLAQNAEVAGHVTGSIEVSEILVLKPSARVDGDIHTNKLIVESGASFNGGCKMGSNTKEIKIGAKEEPTLLKAQS